MEYEEISFELEDGALLIINKPKEYVIKNTTNSTINSTTISSTKELDKINRFQKHNVDLF